MLTPIDWKPENVMLVVSSGVMGRQSLVRPIDWKHQAVNELMPTGTSSCRQSLVTPIDWKTFNSSSLFWMGVAESPILGDAY